MKQKHVIMKHNHKAKHRGPKPLPARRLSAGLGYVIIPPQEDRATYIQQCYRTGTVMLYTEDQEFLANVKIDPNTMNFIEFPEDPEGLGTAVSWICSPLQKQPVIVGFTTKNDEYIDLVEHQFKFKRETDEGYAEVSARGDKGLMFLQVDSEEEDGGKINVTVKNRQNAGELNILVKGKAKLETSDSIDLKTTKDFTITIADPSVDDKQTVLKYTKQDGLTYEDEFGNTLTAKDGEINVISDSIKFSDGAEPMVLGDTLKALMDDFITAVGSITTATSIGAQPIINKAQVDALKQRTAQILSEIATLS